MSFRPISMPVSARAVLDASIEPWANREVVPLMAQLRAYANRGDALNVTLTGAVTDGSASATAAITAALAVSDEIYLPEGVYLISSPITVPSNCVIRGAGRKNTILHCPTGPCFTTTNTSHWSIRDLTIAVDSGDGIYAKAETAQSMLDNSVVSVSINHAAGRGIFLDAEGTGCHFRPVFTDVYLDGAGNGSSLGLKISGDNVDPSAINCVRGSWWAGSLNAMGTGMDFDQLDTFTVWGASFSNFPFAGAGRGIIWRNVNQCASLWAAFEDIDVWVEMVSSLTRFPAIYTTYDWPAGKLLDTAYPAGAGNVTFQSPGGSHYVSKVSGPTWFLNRLIARRTFETPGVGVSLANGLNSDVNISSSSFVKISGPTGAFTVGGMLISDSADSTIPIDGTQTIVWNQTANAMTIANEDLLSTAKYRITTRTGADVVAGANSIVKFIYDTTTSRWILM